MHPSTSAPASTATVSPPSALIAADRFSNLHLNASSSSALTDLPPPPPSMGSDQNSLAAAQSLQQSNSTGGMNESNASAQHNQMEQLKAQLFNYAAQAYREQQIRQRSLDETLDDSHLSASGRPKLAGIGRQYSAFSPPALSVGGSKDPMFDNSLHHAASTSCLLVAPGTIESQGPAAVNRGASSKNTSIRRTRSQTQQTTVSAETRNRLKSMLQMKAKGGAKSLNAVPPALTNNVSSPATVHNSPFHHLKRPADLLQQQTVPTQSAAASTYLPMTDGVQPLTEQTHRKPSQEPSLMPGYGRQGQGLGAFLDEPIAKKRSVPEMNAPPLFWQNEANRSALQQEFALAAANVLAQAQHTNAHTNHTAHSLLDTQTPLTNQHPAATSHSNQLNFNDVRSAFDIFAPIRKVSSEPNLTMRELLRAKILNRHHPRIDGPDNDQETFGTQINNPADTLFKMPFPHHTRHTAMGSQATPTSVWDQHQQNTPLGAPAYIDTVHPMIAAPSMPNLYSQSTPFFELNRPAGVDHVALPTRLDSDTFSAGLNASMGLLSTTHINTAINDHIIQAALASNDPAVAAVALQQLSAAALLQQSSQTYFNNAQAHNLAAMGVAANPVCVLQQDLSSNNTNHATKHEQHAPQPLDIHNMKHQQSVSTFAGPSTALKHQLHNLMMRRKSLVPEETDADVQHQSIDESAECSSVAQSLLAATMTENRNHIEHGGRVQSIWSRLSESGLIAKCKRLPVKKASLDALRLCHSEAYVTFFGVSPAAALKMGASQLPLRLFNTLPCGGMGVDSDTYFNDALTPTGARTAVGALLEVVVQVAEGRIRNGFALIRPPGHHAEREQAMGFCYFNNVAIAARYLQSKCDVGKVAIVDWDVHHGNGTQEMFENDSSVLYISLHRHDNGNFFPGTGAVTECGNALAKGTIVNIPFSSPQPMCDADYLAAWRVVVEPVLVEFNPEIVLVSAGFDAAEGHANALGGYKLSAQLFGWMTERLMHVAPHGKLALALEGGYELSVLADCAESVIGVLSGQRSASLPRAAVESSASEDARETIQKVVAVQKRYWNCLQNTDNALLTMSEAEYDKLRQQMQHLSTEGD